MLGLILPRSLGRGEQGSSIAAPIVADFMADMDARYRAPFSYTWKLQAGLAWAVMD